MSVKEITPHMSDKLRRSVGRCLGMASTRDANRGLHKRLYIELARSEALTVPEEMRHNYIDDDDSSSPAPCQSRDLARARRAASPPRRGPRPAVWVARVFRCARSRAGEIRNAPAGRRRPPADHPDGRRVRLFSADVLSGAGRLQSPGPSPAWCPASAGRAARTSWTTP